MRHNYVGDEGDYAKLSLLRVLARDRQLGVNWYLTVHDEPAKPTKAGTPRAARDGHKREHLQDGHKWSYLDRDLLDLMTVRLGDLAEGERHIRLLEPLLPGGTFYAESLPTGATKPADLPTARAAWHRKALDVLSACDIVFVDPDNGFQVKSHTPRSKWSCKYAFYAEVSDYLRRGQAIVAYQHHRRRRWKAEVEMVGRELMEHDVPTAPPGLIAFGSRGFFLMHRNRSDIRRMTDTAASLRPVAGISEVKGLAITVVHGAD